MQCISDTFRRAGWSHMLSTERVCQSLSRASLESDWLFKNFGSRITRSERTWVLRWHYIRTCDTYTVQRNRESNRAINSHVVAHFALSWLDISVQKTYSLKNGTWFVQLGTYTFPSESLAVLYNTVIVRRCLPTICTFKVLRCTLHFTYCTLHGCDCTGCP